MISIIIPTFNREIFIRQTLDSVYNQTYSKWECIVVDDGSSDNTQEVVQAFCEKDDRFIYLQRPKHRKKGGNAARNYGFEVAKGSYIQWFDSDDLMHPQLLEEQLANIEATHTAFSICRHDRFNEDFTILQKQGVRYIPTYGFYLDYLTTNLAANLQTILFSKSILEPYHLSETLYKSQEFEFLQRFLREQEEHGSFLNKSLVKVRRHANSITEVSTPKRLVSALEVLLTSFFSVPPSAPKEVKKFLVQKYLKTLYIAYRENRATVLLPYTLKVYHFSLKKSILTIPYILMIYVAAKLRIINIRHYKKIYTFYR